MHVLFSDSLCLICCYSAWTTMEKTMEMWISKTWKVTWIRDICGNLCGLTLDLMTFYMSSSVRCWQGNSRHSYDTNTNKNIPQPLHLPAHAVTHDCCNATADRRHLPWRFGRTSWAAAAIRCCPCARARSRGGSRGAWAGWPAGWWGSGRRPADAPGGGVPCWPWSGPPGWEGEVKDKDGLSWLLLFMAGNTLTLFCLHRTKQFCWLTY